MALIHAIAVDPATGLPTGATGTSYASGNTGAASLAKVASAIGTNATSVKASSGRLVGYALTNTTAAFKYFRLYNKAVAPTVGTDSPAMIIGLPPNSTTACNQEGGIGFATGIAYAITGAVADLDATATAANDVVGALFYA